MFRMMIRPSLFVTLGGLGRLRRRGVRCSSGRMMATDETATVRNYFPQFRG